MREGSSYIMKNVMLLVILMLCFILPASATITNALKLQISNASYSDETVIRFVAGATPGFDASYDAWKQLSSNPAVPAVYTVIAPASALCINALPELLTDQQIKVYAKVGSTGDYTITATEIGAFAPNMDVFIENTETGDFQNLRINPTYSFTVSDTGIFNANTGKFMIHFSLPVIFNVTDATRSNNNGSCIISKQGIFNWTYQATNSSSVVVASATISRDKDTLINLPAGNYSFTSYFGNNPTQTQTFTIAAVASDFSFNTDTLIGLNTTVNFLNLSQNGTTYLWDFGDQSPLSTAQDPSHTYSSPGNFSIKLVAQNGASADSTEKTMHVTVSTQVANINTKENCKLFVDDNTVAVDFNSTVHDAFLSLFTIDGREVFNSKSSYVSKITVPMNEQAQGIYIVRLQADAMSLTKKVFIK